jgi:hypothetical protein
MGYVRALLRRWAFRWQLAYSCLQLQLDTLREEFTPMYMSDDATEAELCEMAADQRELAMRQREQATANTSGPVAYSVLRFTPPEMALSDAEIDAWNGYGSDIAELNN